MIVAKLDQSRVLVTTFRQNRLLLKGRSGGQRQTDKPVGFYGPIAPPVPNAPSSECPQFGMPPSFDRSTTPRRRFNYNIPASVVLLQQCHCQNHHRGKLENVSPPSVFQIESKFFYKTQETQTQKMTDQNFEIRIL